ncbi:YjgN family protein [Denitrobaculum tricleocarpae]|uniref:DUF898 domain-containing protein n=1 Tax=Denitrobaculum tricleocarpae TaxID=2591009 RepID=A0A545TQV9_9PROT|nr:DUF898 family protein [Denitrobaculum tricleocarpae]TQV79607.1 DUF898 domain-containing protein [Denitrobaculum tricleocarpae]
MGPATAATAAAGPQEPLHQFAVYDGTSGGIGKIAVTNAILGLLTLGIYRFWGKTNMRRYLWSRLTVLGDRLEYTGTPMELLLGFIVAAVAMAGLSVGFIGLEFLSARYPLFGLLMIFYLLGFYFLIFFAVFRARRYRLLRTQWRGIRFSQSGSATGYAFRAMGLMFLTGITLGLTYPYMQARLQNYRTNNTWFGNRQLTFDGKASKLFWKWVLALVLVIPTLGISFLWYKVTEFRYFASRTRFGALSFHSTLETMKIFLIYLIFAVVFGIIWFSLLEVIGVFVGDLFNIGQPGAAEPFANLSTVTIAITIAVSLVIVSLLNALQFILLIHPIVRAISETLLVKGTIDLDEIKQSDAERGGRGEGLADVLDVGAI